MPRLRPSSLAQVLQLEKSVTPRPPSVPPTPPGVPKFTQGAHRPDHRAPPHPGSLQRPTHHTLTPPQRRQQLGVLLGRAPGAGPARLSTSARMSRAAGDTAERRCCGSTRPRPARAPRPAHRRALDQRHPLPPRTTRPSATPRTARTRPLPETDLTPSQRHYRRCRHVPDVASSQVAAVAA